MGNHWPYPELDPMGAALGPVTQNVSPHECEYMMQLVKNAAFFLLPLLVVFSFIGQYSCSSSESPPPCDEVVLIPDQALEKAIREWVDKPDGDICKADLETITVFDPRNKIRGLGYVRDLTGLEYCSNLTELWLSFNNDETVDLTPLSNLTKLQNLLLDDSRIDDFSPLFGLPSLNELYISDTGLTDVSFLSQLNLKVLYLNDNQIEDISPMANLSNLQDLVMVRNEISDLSPLSDLVKIETLWLGYNRIYDVSPIAGLSNIGWLVLENNLIEDIGPLASGKIFTSWGRLSLMDNPLNKDSINTYIPQLQNKGVEVDW